MIRPPGPSRKHEDEEHLEVACAVFFCHGSGKNVPGEKERTRGCANLAVKSTGLALKVKKCKRLDRSYGVLLVTIQET